MLRGMVKMIHEKVIQYLIKKAKDEKSLVFLQNVGSGCRYNFDEFFWVDERWALNVSSKV